MCAWPGKIIWLGVVHNTHSTWVDGMGIMTGLGTVTCINFT